MEINGYILEPEIEALMTSRGIKQSDLELLTSAAKAKRFYNADRSFEIVKCYTGVNTYYIESKLSDGRKIITDTYCHWVSVISDM